MRKIFLSISALTILVIFGAVTFVIIAGPGSLARHPEISAASAVSNVAMNEPGPAPFTFDPAAVSYEVSQPDYAWIDISSNSDEQIQPSDFEDNVGSAAIDIGFYFPFFENIYHQLRLSDNGYLYFAGEAADGGNTPQAVPSQEDLIHNLIALLGADLFRNPNDSVVYVSRQTEPERRLVVQFENAYRCCNLAAPNDFQVVLYPDGRILSQYQSIQSQEPAYDYVTAGIENEDGSRGYNFYTGLMNDTNVFVRFINIRVIHAQYFCSKVVRWWLSSPYPRLGLPAKFE